MNFIVKKYFNILLISNGDKFDFKIIDDKDELKKAMKENEDISIVAIEFKPGDYYFFNSKDVIEELEDNGYIETEED